MPWAKRAGYKPSRLGPEGTLYSDQGGTLRIFRDGGHSVVALDNERGLFVASSDPLVLEKYIWAKLGPLVRKSMGYAPELVMRYVDLAPSWSVLSTPDGLSLLRDGNHTALLGGTVSREDAVYLSRVLAAPDILVRGSFVNARGSHLFSPIDYFTREVPVVDCAHERSACTGPVSNPYLSLGADSTGWGDVRRCLCCGRYWLLLDRTNRPMSAREISESLPWELLADGGSYLVTDVSL